LLERASGPLITGRELVERALSLLAWWERLNLDRAKLNPVEDEARDSELQIISERLADVLLQLQRESNQLADDVRQTVSTTIEGALGDAFSFLVGLRAEFRSTPAARTSYAKLASYEASGADLNGWSEVATVDAGSWSLLLAGTASPSPILFVTLQALDTQAASEPPTLSLVRPNQGFETANVESEGLGKVNLPVGQTILLVQGEKEIWQVPLTLRER
jgi:hypothetical protein